MSDWMQSCLKALAAGGVVACPTETFYGLLADALQPQAVAKCAQLKGRSADAPIALLLPNAEAVPRVAEPLSPDAEALARRHWPGPLTLVQRARPGLDPLLLRDGKVGMRVPGPSAALDLVRAYGGPLTATSANLTGEAPVSTAEALAEALRNQVDVVVPGRTSGAAPSTVLDVSVEPFVVIRAGAIPIDPQTR